MQAGDRQVDLSAEINAEQIRMLYAQQPLTFAGTLVVAFVAAGVLAGEVDTVKLVAWEVAVVGIVLVRAVNLWLFRRQYVATPDIAGWRWRATGFAFLSGCAWASLPVMFISGDEPFTMINIVVFCVGMLSGSLASQCVHLATLYAFSIPLMIGMSVSVHVNGGEFSHFAYLGYAFSLVMIGFARSANRVFCRSIEMRFENARLIEELRIQKAEAEAANLAKSKFLAAASHDLRQPLHAVGLYAGTLNDLAVNDRQRELNEKMSSAIDALDQLLGHILEVSKLDAGVIDPVISDFPFGDVLERLDLRYGAIAAERGLQYRSEGHELIIRSDRMLLERILDNLLANAFAFTEKGSIEVAAREKDDLLEISVVDTGSGIPDDEHENIFQEFYQVGNPERDRSKGLGLGLSIVHRLSALLGHSLTLESTPGAGSRFTLAVHAGTRDRIELRDDAERSAQWALDGVYVVVIDDEQAVRDSTAAQLRSWGCTVRTADSLSQALDIRGEDEPDLLIVDYRLRDHQSGIDAILGYRDSVKREIPAVLVTGDTAPERIREAVDSGITLLHKPVSPAKLRMCVSQLTSRNTRGGLTSPARTAR